MKKSNKTGRLLMLSLAALASFGAVRANELSFKKEEVYSDVKIIECKLFFKVNTWEIDQTKLQTCFGEVDKNKIASFDVYATASPDGTQSKNQTLADRRTQSTREALNAMFPNIPTTAKSGGQSRTLMRSALVVAILKPDLTTTIKTCPAVKETVCPAPPIEAKTPIYEKFGLMFWGGIEAVFVPSPLSNYVQVPFYGIIIGMSKDIMRLGKTNNLYGSLVFDYANSDKNLGKSNAGGDASGLYYFVNLQALVGIEQEFIKDRFSLYLDVGPVLQQRSFLVRESDSSINDYSISATIGASANVGATFFLNKSKRASYFLKLNFNGMMGPAANKRIYFNGSYQSIDTNSPTLTPSLSFGVKI